MRVVVAIRDNNRAQWELCFICKEADHAPYVAQVIKNQEESAKSQVGYINEDDWDAGKLGKMKLVKRTSVDPDPPASSVDKFKEDPIYVPAPKTAVQAPVSKKQNKKKAKESRPAPAPKQKSELGMFKRREN